MTVTVTPAPSTSPPDKYGSDPAAFDVAMQAHLTWMTNAAPELNAQNIENNSINAQVNASKTAAAASASASATSATAAAASANFKGTWSALTGALNMPASVLHNGQIWQLTANLANVTTAQPGVSSNWYPMVNLDVASRAPIQPTLDLDFANQRYRVLDGALGLKEIALADILTYTGSGRSYTDALGILRAQSSNVPRLEFDPATGAGQGLSVWGARTNLLTYSEQFDNAAWTKTGTTTIGTANSALAPAGTLTADALIEDSTNAAHSVTQSQTITSGTTYTYSVHAKETPTGAKRYLSVSLASTVFGANMRVTVDLATGSSVPLNAPIATSVQALGNGWWRISITALATATLTGGGLVSLRLFNAPTDTLGTYTGDGTSGLYLWGAQLEASTTASPYIPTAAAAVTAPADVASITGASFAKWYSQVEGTLVVVGAASPASSKSIVAISDGSGSERYQLSTMNSTTMRLTVTDALGGGTGTQATLDATVNLAQANKFVASYAANNVSLAVNGGAAIQDTSATLPSVDRLIVGAAADGNSHSDGTISRILYFPRALPAHLQALSA